MTQTSKTQVPAADITGDFLRTTDTNTIEVVTPSGHRFGAPGKASITFGLGSWDGDYDGFAEWLATQP